MNYDEDAEARWCPDEHLGAAPGRKAGVPEANSPPGHMVTAHPNAAELARIVAAARLTKVAGTPRLLAYAPPGYGPGRKRAGNYFGENELAHVLARIAALSPVPEANAVMVLATYRAGLRPCEVAGLERRTLCTASGELKDQVDVTGSTAKRGKWRSIPMHPQLRGALVDLFAKYPHAERVAIRKVGPSGELAYHTIANLTNWYAALYLGAGLHGCTGMSGRRSFATNLARYAPLSLVQQALGHASLRMLEYYVRPTGDLEAAIRQLGGAE